MDKSSFESLIIANASTIRAIRDAAWKLHDSVNQKYDEHLPYGYHLNMVADAAMRWGNSVVTDESDILPLIFGAYFHDGIEDARLSYNDVVREASGFMNPDQALTAAEIVYALTNEKGRTRSERASDRYYEGIRSTPFAPFVKLCDRYANTLYSHSDLLSNHQRMLRIYSGEWQHFIEMIDAKSDDARFSLPADMVAEIEKLIIK
ncbi:MAG: hypothetical protein Q4Q28_04405 [Bacteroidales bacterium]|nr:hypothetical protein [Bacteroidales bacterium]